jgi:hypothetical protein
MKRSLHRTVRSWATALLTASLLTGGMVSTAFAQSSTWSLDEYTRLSNAMAAADEDLALTVPGTDSWRTSNIAALDARRALVSYITSALRSGDMPEDFVEPATQARFVLVQNIISINTDLGFCEQANTALAMLRDVSDSSDAVRAAFDAAQADVTGCVPYSPDDALVSEVVEVEPDPADTEPSEPVVTEEPDTEVVSAETESESNDTASSAMTDAPPARTASGRRTAGIVMLGTGAALALGGVGLDLAGGGNRSEFTDLSRTCDGSEDCVARLNELSDSINGAKVPVAAMTIGGGVIAATGIVLWITAPRDREARGVSLVPDWRPGYVGATFTFR